MLAATGGDEQTDGGTMLEISGTECTEEGNALLQCLQGLSSVLDWTHGFSIHQQVFDAELKLETLFGRVTPRHTAECQALLQEHQWEGNKPMPWGQ